MKHIARNTIIAFLLLLSIALEAQIITSDPAIPFSSQAVTIYFDASLGTTGLKDFTGDVYAHTGVITNLSNDGTDWKYVKTNWGENTAETKLSRISTNLYSLEITPSIRNYYGVTEGETITHMTFVFRSDAEYNGSYLEGKDTGGADIFAEVFEEGLNVSIVNPDKNQITNVNTDIAFSASSSEEALLSLFLNNNLVKSLTSTTLTHNFNFDTPGDYWLKIIAVAAEEEVADSVFVHVMTNQILDPLPEGSQDGINYIDDNTVRLVLYAPGKESVFVIGDFNNWIPQAAARMFKDNNRFWLNINGLNPGEEYAYQYLVDGELYIADPYTVKVLDPWNDKWISSATYPDLKPYPSGLTSGIVSVIQPGLSPYEWKSTNYTPPDKENLIIYELLVRDFIAAHDWLTLIDTLDYFSTLGINAIELLPVNEFEGNESWGYNPSFYLAPDKYYGPANDLKAFIDSCHSRDIAVIIDIAMNHSFSQSPLVQLYYNGSTGKVSSDNPWYNIDSPNSVYSWGFDFDHESSATQYFVDRVNSHWLTEFNVDGFRFDFTKGFTNTPGDGSAYDASRIAILKRMADEIWTVKPDAYVILEHFAPNNEEEELSNHGMMVWGNINYNYNEATMAYHENGKSNFNWISYKNRGWSDPHVVGYMESHDEERLMFKNLAFGNSDGNYNITNLNTALERMELAGAFFFTIPGPKMIWQFGELGYDYSIDFNGRVGNKPIRWDYYDVGKRLKLYQIYSSLIHLKTSEPAFSSNDFILNVSYAIKRIELNHADMDVRIIGNFDVVANEIDPNFSKTGLWYDFFTGDSINVTNTNDLISLYPGEYRIYTTKYLKTPEITAAIENYSLSESSTIIYPVPSTEILYVSTVNNTRSITVFDLNGRMMTQFNSRGTQHTLNISKLNSGVYFLQIEFEEIQAEYLRFLKE